MSADPARVTVLYSTIVAALAAWEPRKEGDGVRARCPAHAGKGRNLAVDPGPGGSALITCHSRGCTYEQILTALSLGNAGTSPSPRGRGKRTTPRRDPDYVWRYLGADGREVGRVIRWDRQHGENDPCWSDGETKIVRPRKPDGRGGLLKKAPDIWPLYGLPGLMERPTAPVLIVEGEKAASRAAAALDAVCVTTSAMGSKSAGRTDWSPLRERECVIWPDADEPGMKYARTLARLVPDLQCVDTSGLPDGWDLGDPLPDGWTADTVIARLKAAKPIEPAHGGVVPEGTTRPGLERVFAEMGVSVRWNTRALRAQILLPDADGWQGIKDRIEADLLEEIAARFRVPTKGGDERPLVFGRDVWWRCFNAVQRHNEVDPFKEWFEGLPEWDGTERADHLLSFLFGAEEGPITQWCSRYLGVGAIQRTYEPGAELHEIPVLISAEQGLGKTSFSKAWLPPEHRTAWFGGGLKLSDTQQKRAEVMQGKVITELAELAGLSRAALEDLKDFLTSTNDGMHRAAYARNPEDYPRMTVMVGTTNDRSPLPNDASGNRRFVPVELSTGADVHGYFDAHREQLWAECLARYTGGLRANMPRDLMPEAAEAAERFRGVDALEDRVGEVLGELWVTGTTVSDIAHTLDLLEPSVAMQKRLASALVQHGWVKSRERSVGGRRTMWRPGPDAERHDPNAVDPRAAGWRP